MLYKGNWTFLRFSKTFWFFYFELTGGESHAFTLLSIGCCYVSGVEVMDYIYFTTVIKVILLCTHACTLFSLCNGCNLKSNKKWIVPVLGHNWLSQVVKYSKHTPVTALYRYYHAKQNTSDFVADFDLLGGQSMDEWWKEMDRIDVVSNNHQSRASSLSVLCHCKQLERY